MFSPSRIGLAASRYYGFYWLLQKKLEISPGKVHPLSAEAVRIYIITLWFVAVSDRPSVCCATSTTSWCLLCDSYSYIPAFAVPLTSDSQSLRTPLRLANRTHLLYAIGELSSPRSKLLSPILYLWQKWCPFEAHTKAIAAMPPIVGTVRSSTVRHNSENLTSIFISAIWFSLSLISLSSPLLVWLNLSFDIKSFKLQISWVKFRKSMRLMGRTKRRY